MQIAANCFIYRFDLSESIIDEQEDAQDIFSLIPNLGTNFLPFVAE